jgi:hypothetical protein
MLDSILPYYVKGFSRPCEACFLSLQNLTSFLSLPVQNLLVYFSVLSLFCKKMKAYGIMYVSVPPNDKETIIYWHIALPLQF